MSAADVAWQGDTDSAQTPLQGLGKKGTQISLQVSLRQNEEHQWSGRDPVGTCLRCHFMGWIPPFFHLLHEVSELPYWQPIKLILMIILGGLATSICRDAQMQTPKRLSLEWIPS